MLGTYNTRSATTNPTGKNRFDAGMNGSTIKQRAQKGNANNISNQDIGSDKLYPRNKLKITKIFL